MLCYLTCGSSFAAELIVNATTTAGTVTAASPDTILVPVIIAPTTTVTTTAAATEISAAPVITAPSLVKIEGRLFERGTKKPLPQVNIYCFAATNPDKPVKTTTDKAGRFIVEVAEGKHKWVLSVSGYKRLELQDEQSADKASNIRVFYLEKTSYLTTYETTVYGQTEKRDDKTKSLTQEQFSTVPGAGGDPVKAVQNLPGVNRPKSFGSQVIIEGSSPFDTRYLIDQQNVPIIFHFGGLSSVVLPEAIDHVDYLSAGFGPEYGQTTAGLVNLAVRDPKTDRKHGFAFADLQNAGGMVEGPIDDHSSYLVGMRQSYIGYVLREVILRGDQNDNKNFELTAVPEYRDLVVNYKNTLSPEDSVRIVTIGSQDTFAFLLKQPADEDPSIRGRFKLDTRFFRVIPEWTRQVDPDTIVRVSMGGGRDQVLFDIGDRYFHLAQTAVTGRAEFENQVNASWKSIAGFDMQRYITTQSFQFPIVYVQGGIASTSAAGEMQTVSRKYQSASYGLYWRNTLHAQDSRWTYQPGLRISYFNQTDEKFLEPRAGVKYALDQGWTLRTTGGLYNQPPPVGNLDKGFGNPELKSQRATHYTFGLEKDFRDGAATGWSISSDLFSKRLWNMPVRSTKMITPSQPEYFNNSGYGKIYGFELMGKYRTDNWQGWVSYTLSRSTRGDAETPNGLSEYDQTHLLTIVGDRELGNNWKISTRIRYATGNLYTPIIGSVLDVDNDVYTPTRGPVYSQRLGAFFQADVRLDKKWVYDTWILTGYLDIQNVTNRKNPEQINYSYDYQQSATVTGLPIFPILGVKAEF